MSGIDIFVSPTGTITLDHKKKKLKNNTFVGNTGHFGNEVDLAGSEGFEESKFWHHEFLHSFLRHLPGDRRTIWR